jgi:ABC1 atypical kinase-like domain
VIALDLPLLAVGTVLTVLLFAFGVRRLLGLRLSTLRTLVAGLVAFAVASPIITTIGRSAVTSKKPAAFPAVLFVILGVAIALLVGMVVLVIAEALVPSGSVPGPVYMVRGLRRRLGRARRYSQISRILVRRGLLPYQRGGRRSELATPDGRARLARSLRLALEDGGVTFVKLGQVLSTRRDLLPAEFTRELSRLQDDAAGVPWPRIEQVLRSELGADVGELFATFEREPLAAASIAQVHAATLASGARVVVKVRRPDVGEIVERDLDIVGRLAVRLQRSTTWGRAVGAVGLADALLEVVERPEELDEPRLERMLGRFVARHTGPGMGLDAAMFTDLFRIVSGHGLAVPPEIAAVFRALATVEGTLTQLAPGFDIVAEARRFAADQLVEQFSPDALRRTAADELVALLPMLRRLPRRVDRIAGALEAGRLSVGVRLLADSADRRYLTGLLHQVILAILAATSGVMAVLLLGLHGGPSVTRTVTLYTFFGYCLLVIAAIFAVRVLVLVFHQDAR